MTTGGQFPAIVDLINGWIALPLKAYEQNEVHFINLLSGKGLTCMASTVDLSHRTVEHNSFADMLLLVGYFLLLQCYF